MNGLHVALFSAAGATCVNPTLSVVSTLIRRGYRVTYVTSVEFAREIERLGARVLTVPVRATEYNRDRKDTVAKAEWPRKIFSLTKSFYEKDRPDILLYDAITFAGAVIAKNAGIPAIRMTPELAFSEQNLGSTSPEFRASFIEEPREYARKFLGEHGLHQPDIRRDRFGPTVYFYLRELQLGTHDADRTSLYAARCAAERPLLEMRKRVCANDRKAVMIAASTSYVEKSRYYGLCLEALSGLGFHAVIPVADDAQLELGELPPNTQVVRGVPQIALMPEVDLIICFGGMMTLMEALYHGIPLLMLTNGYPEGELYADNVERHGLGIHLRGNEPSALAVRDAILRITESSEIQNRVKRMQVATKISPGGEEVCNWLEAHIGSTS